MSLTLTDVLSVSLIRGAPHVGLRVTARQAQALTDYVVPHLRLAIAKSLYPSEEDLGFPKMVNATLTKREREAIVHMIWGHTVAETARHLHLTDDTVRSHRRRVFKKLGVRGTAETIVHVHVHGYMDITEVFAMRPDNGVPESVDPDAVARYGTSE